mmetsp:Transcript_10728/g.23633  ORF Transcript_10728/g.23633 Transcript_10728/m.23633 type:complete len:170 (+) Transcript_10728:76-585(+)
MLRRTAQRSAGGGGLAESFFPGYKDKVWAALPPAVRSYQINASNSAFEGWCATHMRLQGVMEQWEGVRSKMAPSQKFRKPYVDWRRQQIRGTMHYGRWYEGPKNSDYRPDSTHDRLQDVRQPFTPEEWEERKQFRSWCMVSMGLGLWVLFAYYKVTTEVPVVWCEEQEE